MPVALTTVAEAKSNAAAPAFRGPAPAAWPSRKSTLMRPAPGALSQTVTLSGMPRGTPKNWKPSRCEPTPRVATRLSAGFRGDAGPARSVTTLRPVMSSHPVVNRNPVSRGRSCNVLGRPTRGEPSSLVRGTSANAMSVDSSPLSMTVNVIQNESARTTSPATTSASRRPQDHPIQICSSRSAIKIRPSRSVHRDLRIKICASKLAHRPVSRSPLSARPPPAWHWMRIALSLPSRTRGCRVRHVGLVVVLVTNWLIGRVRMRPAWRSVAGKSPRLWPSAAAAGCRWIGTG